MSGCGSLKWMFVKVLRTLKFGNSGAIARS